MKRICGFILINFVVSFFIYGQNVDRSIYQEYTLMDVYTKRHSPSGTQYFKSIAHFTWYNYNSTMNYFQTAFYQDGFFLGPRCYFNINDRMRVRQIAIIYYRFITDGTGGFYLILDDIELVDYHFIIETRYIVTENLRLRNKGNLSGNIIRTIEKGNFVTVIEEGNLETIDDLTSAWVKVRLSDNTEGWCFGGYLGFKELNE
jgi:hypothetical protein